MGRLFLEVFLRDLRLAARRRIETLLPLAFFAVAVSLFPLGVGPEPQTLRLIAPGVVWVCALLASMLSVATLYAGDHADGSLEQMLLAPQPAVAVAAAKAAAHWVLSGLPLVALVIGLLLGTPVLSLLGGLGAALVIGLRSGGMLLILIVLPLATPALIFGAGAAATVEQGLSASGHYSLLGALLIATACGAPFATAAALRISTE
jgi:heme exporter protein B